MQTTVKDVAKLANVSVSTVSRVLTGNAPVSAQLRDRVIAAVEELGYRPNALARGLRVKRTAIIGLIIPDISNPFFGQLAQVIEKTANLWGYSILLCNSLNSQERELQYLELLRSQQVDGLLVVTSGAISTELDEFSRVTGAPALALDRQISGFSGPWVGVDPYPGAKAAVKHLYELGHRHIGVIQGLEGNHSSEERCGAIRRAFQGVGFSSDYWSWSGEYTLETGYAAGEALSELSTNERPSAVIATSEFTAYGLIKAVSDHGLLVPEELSVVGYDNTVFASIFRPALTVIAQPIEEMGTLAITKILEQINREQEKKVTPIAPLAGYQHSKQLSEEGMQTEVLPTYLVERRSTAPCNLGMKKLFVNIK